MNKQESEDYINKRLIYCALLLQDYAYRELLSSPLINSRIRYKIKTKYRFIKNQLLQLEKDSGISKKMIDKSEDLAMNNVALMATIMGTLAIVPGCQVDFIEEEFEKVMVQAMERFNNSKLKKEENEMDY